MKFRRRLLLQYIVPREVKAKHFHFSVKSTRQGKNDTFIPTLLFMMMHRTHGSLIMFPSVYKLSTWNCPTLFVLLVQLPWQNFYLSRDAAPKHSRVFNASRTGPYCNKERWKKWQKTWGKAQGTQLKVTDRALYCSGRSFETLPNVFVVTMHLAQKEPDLVQLE